SSAAPPARAASAKLVRATAFAGAPDAGAVPVDLRYQHRFRIARSGSPRRGDAHDQCQQRYVQIRRILDGLSISKWSNSVARDHNMRIPKPSSGTGSNVTLFASFTAIHE